MMKNSKNQQPYWNGTIIWYRLLEGAKSLLTVKGTIPFVLFALAALAFWYYRFEIIKIPRFYPQVRLWADYIILFIYGVAMLLLLLILGMPKGGMGIAHKLLRIGLHNSLGEIPVLINRVNDKHNPQIERLTLVSFGIPLSVWKKKKDEIESALNIRIADITQGRTMQHFVIAAVNGITTLPRLILWRRELIHDEDFALQLGVGYLGVVSIDLSIMPHMLLGGTTGSGKSALLKLILFQCIEKGAHVAIADFKGGVDFGRYWKQKAALIYDEREMHAFLKMAIEEMEKRKKCFNDKGCKNLHEYNQKASSYKPRIIIACDEVAELFDRTGLQKEQKQQLSEIESMIKTIARQGRAFGLHLILATQRPDANVLSGQIKSNIDCRICGRADNVLSQIILDNTSANDEIPKDAQGRFIMSDGTVFQAYMLENDQRRDKHRKLS